ncbi:MAG: hypothetical protein WCG27_12150, partial [Pseudomonadota bacterium]
INIAELKGGWPTITVPPGAFEEGVQSNLDPKQLQELIPWAENTLSFLDDLLRQTNNMKKRMKVQQLFNGIQNGVLSSLPKHTELLMRYILNRGLFVYDIVDKTMRTDDVHTLRIKIRILEQSILMAKKYFQSDLAFLKANPLNFRPLDYVQFGKDYSNFLANLNKSVFSAAAQYKIELANLGWLMFDLNRDQDKTKYSRQILKIYFSIQGPRATYSQTPPANDQESLELIRQMKTLRASLDLALDVDMNQLNGVGQGQDQGQNQQTSQQESNNGLGDIFTHQEDPVSKLTGPVICKAQCLDNDFESPIKDNETLGRNFVIGLCNANTKHNLFSSSDCARWVDCSPPVEGDHGKMVYQNRYTCVARTTRNPDGWSNVRYTEEAAKGYVINVCQRSKHTNNHDCANFADCAEIGREPKGYVCTTFTQGKDYSYKSWTEEVAKNFVIAYCRSFPKTKAGECYNNVSCKIVR